MASPALDMPPRVLSPRDLERWPIVTLSREANLAYVIERWFHRAYATPQIVSWCNTLHTTASLTVAGVGISLLPPVIFEEELSSKKLITIPTRPAVKPIEFWSAYTLRDEKLLPQTIAALAKAISTFDA
jgi:DNA-binding transcriptional LysR family regulator